LTDLRSLSPEEIVRLVREHGGTSHQGERLARSVLGRGVATLADTGVSRRLLARLPSEITLSSVVIEDQRLSKDGTAKLLYRLADGARVEGVRIPEPSRETLCVSTQVGCASGCAFCLSGSGGLSRNLTRAEMLGQVHAASTGTRSLTNIVLMGSGEPLANLDEVAPFVDVAVHRLGLNLSPRKLTLSTSGLVPGIRKMADRLNISLAVSLNAPDDATRSRLMPINRKYPLIELMKALFDFCQNGRKVIIEYILIRGVNDSSGQAEELVKLLSGLPCMINLLRFNPFDGTPFARPDEDAVRAFQKILLDAGFVSVVRDSRGIDIGAACGQLRAEKQFSL